MRALGGLNVFSFSENKQRQTRIHRATLTHTHIAENDHRRYQSCKAKERVKPKPKMFLLVDIR